MNDFIIIMTFLTIDVAEALYLFFISDTSCVKTEDPSVPFGDFEFSLTSEGYQEVLDLLVQTQWDVDSNRVPNSKDMIAERRNQLLTLFQFEIQNSQAKLPSTSTRKVNKEKKDELDSYDALVREAGNPIYQIFLYFTYLHRILK
jgi:hypothetical protein